MFEVAPVNIAVALALNDSTWLAIEPRLSATTGAELSIPSAIPSPMYQPTSSLNKCEGEWILALACAARSAWATKAFAAAVTAPIAELRPAASPCPIYAPAEKKAP